jgi:hypothetical protein
MSLGGPVLALSGGVGGAKLALGLYRTLPPDTLTIVANTGDDFEHLGLRVSPDLDTLLYTLSGQDNPELGWGRAGETWTFMAALEALGGETWFRLGDGDLATHVERTRRLKSGETLAAVMDDFRRRLGIAARLVPMSDDPVRTRLRTAPTLPSPAGGGGLGRGASRGVEAKTVLVHTAAGGVGSAAVQLARIAGMRVIGVAGSAAKTRAVLALGAEAAINYRVEDVVARVRAATGGRGADLILDPVGGKGFARNFAMLAPLGLVVSYGRLDGPPDPAFVAAMREHGAVSPAVRFFTIHSFDDRPDIRAAATGALIDWLAKGEIRPLIHARLPLAEAARAHEMLEAGEVIGKIVMKP